MLSGFLKFVKVGSPTTTSFSSSTVGPINSDERVSENTGVSARPQVIANEFNSTSEPELSLNELILDRNETCLNDLDVKADDDTAYSVIEMYQDEHSDVEMVSETPISANNEDFDILDTIGAATDTIVATSNDVNTFDRYGFRKQSKFSTIEQYDTWWDTYSIYCIKHKYRWQKLIESSGLSLDNDSPQRFPPKCEKLKNFVRNGIPAEWRGNAWWHFARGQDLLNKNKGLYQRLLVKVSELQEIKTRNKKNTNSIHLPDLDVIERDLNRTFPDNIHFQKESFQLTDPPIINSLRNVLIAFSLYNPNIGYCQSMNFLVGLLLLFMDEEKSFWILVIITTRYLPGVHSITLEGVNIDQGVLMLCIKEYLPEMWPYIETTYNRNPKKPLHLTRTHEFLHRLPHIALCTASWFMSCFVGTFPIETTLRVWDCMFYEESNFLFKISLSVLKLSEQYILQEKPFKTLFDYSIGTAMHDSDDTSCDMMNKDELDAEVFQVLQTLPKKLLDPNRFFNETILKRRSFCNKIDQEEIDRIRKYVVSQRSKYKRYSQVFGLDFDGPDNRMSLQLNKNMDNSKQLSEHMINETISTEINGLGNGHSGATWNSQIKSRVRQMHNPQN